MTRPTEQCPEPATHGPHPWFPSLIIPEGAHAHWCPGHTEPTPVNATPNLRDTIHNSITASLALWNAPLPATFTASHPMWVWTSLENYLTYVVTDIVTHRTSRPAGACTAVLTMPIGGDMSVSTACQYDHNHTGGHRDTDGTTWTDAPLTPAPCGAEPPPAEHRCIRSPGHVGEHYSNSHRWGTA